MNVIYFSVAPSKIIFKELFKTIFFIYFFKIVNCFFVQTVGEKTIDSIENQQKKKKILLVNFNLIAYLKHLFLTLFQLELIPNELKMLRN